MKDKKEAIKFSGPGVKHDENKIEWDLMYWPGLLSVMRVLMFGKIKYAKYGWQKVKRMKTRYSNAAMRHLVSIMQGEWLDPETGEPHAAHIICCMLFIMWYKNNHCTKKKKVYPICACDNVKMKEWPWGTDGTLECRDCGRVIS